MLAVIKNALQKHFDHTLVEELLEAYQESKRNFLAGGLRLNAVEGGRFCEAAFRILEQAASGTFTPLNHQINVENLMSRLANVSRGVQPDSVRLHIPRALRVVYDIRNNRDVAHLADGIDPNLQDATLVVSILDWVLAEFVRLYYGCTPCEAQNVISALVTRRVPAIQDFDGFLKILKPKLRVCGYILLLLYERGGSGALYAEIEEWVKPSMRRNLQRTLHRLIHEAAFVHFDGNRHFITRLGMIEVENRQLHQ